MQHVAKYMARPQKKNLQNMEFSTSKYCTDMRGNTVYNNTVYNICVFQT